MPDAIEESVCVYASQVEPPLKDADNTFPTTLNETVTPLAVDLV